MSKPRRSLGSRRRVIPPADRAAVLALVDAQGHKLTSVYRYLNEDDPWKLSFDYPKKGVLIHYEVDPLNELQWTQLIFHCRACRDGHGPTAVVSSVEVAALVVALALLWDEARHAGRPVKGEYVTTPDPAGYP